MGSFRFQGWFGNAFYSVFFFFCFIVVIKHKKGDNCFVLFVNEFIYIFYKKIKKEDNTKGGVDSKAL